jgi:hypothetical protein
VFRHLGTARGKIRLGATLDHVWLSPEPAAAIVSLPRGVVTGAQSVSVPWRDARTTFELVRDPRRSVSTVYGRLSDREVEARPGPSGAGE